MSWSTIDSPAGAGPMRIGELARLTAVSRRSLRYYEQQGLLDSGRIRSDQRIYRHDAAERVALIQECFAAGLCSTRIRALLATLDRGAPNAAADLRTQLTAELGRLDTQLADLERNRATLLELRDRLIETADIVP